MRTAIVIGMAAAAAASAGCARDRGEAAGPATTRNFAVGGFERIEVAGPYEVTVATGGAPSVRASGGERAIERMVVEVEGDTLKIHPKKRSGLSFSWSRSHPVKLTVTVPRLTAAGIAGSGAITVDKVAGDAFEAGVAGSGNLRLGEVDVKRLKAGIAGSGEINAGRGRAAVADYEIAGSGDIDAAGLVAETASVSIAGSGNVAANATGTASVDIAGSGDVRMTGGAKCQVSKAGSGNVDCS
ncbi:MAG TPA: head GIN domain-containing protein [Sphingomicrobium sp.]|nr:head GIN domain-containing protein [Sphingomicrobium sp.]